MNEPSVLDVFKEKIKFWRKKKLETNQVPKDELPPPDLEKTTKQKIIFPYLTIVAVFLAILAQTFLEPPDRTVSYAVVLYIGAAAAIVGGIFRKEWHLPEIKQEESKPLSLKVRWIPLLVSLPFFILAFITFGGNKFTALNTLLWITAIILLWSSIWLPTKSKKTFSERIQTLKDFKLKIHVTPWAILLILTCILIIFFRFYQLNQTPGEMFSDHAEKLLDVADVLNGKFSIFFPRNTGREAFQMYLTAGIAKILGTGLSFISLKIGTVLAGLFALPFIYLIGKEIANRWVGWFALILAGVAYWPNVISRVGLRFPLYPMFVASCFYFLIKGLKRSNRNDLVLSGLFLGIGLHGYSPFRLVPFIVVFGFFLYIVHPIAKGTRKSVIWNLLLLAVISFAIFLPLFRYILEDPSGFGIRALSRLGSIEQPLPGPAIKIFLSNLFKASVMFFYDNGEIWVHSIPHRPALDLLTAAFFFIGLVLIVIRYIKKRTWLDLFLVLSIPLLLMPSVLSLTFPAENPSLNRTAGAIVPVFIIAGFGLYSAFASIWKNMRNWIGKGMTIIGSIAIFIGIFSSNYDLFFHQYHDEFLAGAWNTSDIGSVIRGFTQTIGSPDNAYVVPYPYWVDTRLVGINAGYPLKDYALWPDSFESTLNVSGPKLFILKSEDIEDLAKLQKLYPKATTFHYADEWQGKDFNYLVVLSQ
jgi:hypothetical protein